MQRQVGLNLGAIWGSCYQQPSWKAGRRKWVTRAEKEREVLLSSLGFLLWDCWKNSTASSSEDSATPPAPQPPYTLWKIL